MSLTDWLGMVTQLLSFTIGSLGSFTITIGGVMALVLGFVGVMAALSLLMRVIFSR